MTLPSPLNDSPEVRELQAQLAAMETRLRESEEKLAEAQELIRAIQSGEVDAVVVSGPKGEQIFTLKDAEYSYRSLVEAMNEGAATLAGDGTVLYCNRQISRLLGLPIEQVIGQSAARLLWDDQESFQRLLTDALKGNASKAGMNLETADGRRIPIQISLKRTQTDESAVLSMVVTDLSEARRREESLRESERVFTTLANHVPQLVWMCTPDGLNIYFNTRWTNYTGLTLEESLGRGWNTPFHPNDKQAAWDAWNHAVESGETYRVESRLRAADGGYRWFLMRGEPLKDAEGNIVRWFGTCTDIEDMKQAEQEQRVQRRIIEEIVQNLPCGVALVRGRDLTYQLVNPAYQTFAPGAAMLGRSLEEVWPESHPLFSERCRSVLETGEPFHIEDEEIMLRRPNDGPLEFACYSWSAHRFSLPGADEDGILITVWDTTPRKLTERALHLQSSQLRALSERMHKVREEDRRNIARDLHDRLGQILTAIKMDLSWIARHEAKQQDGIDDRLARSINLISEGSQVVRKICQGLRPPVLDDLGLAAAIESEANEFISLSGIPCVVSAPDGDLSLDGEVSITLFRIFQECLTNVMRHSEAHSVRVSLERKEARIRLEVADDGKGFQESASYGSLGLLGMKERAQSCGGKLTIATSPGAGTTVTVSVPIDLPGRE